MRLLPLACIAAGIFLTGCASHIKLAKSDQPAVLQEDWNRKEITVWESTRVFRIDDVEFGHLRYEKEARFSVDPGRKRQKRGQKRGQTELTRAGRTLQ